jgi:hypothetical protein
MVSGEADEPKSDTFKNFSILGRFITLKISENFYRSAKLWRPTRNIFKKCVLNSYVICGIHKVVVENELFYSTH